MSCSPLLPSLFIVLRIFLFFSFFFFNDTATTEIYTLSLHDALPICRSRGARSVRRPVHQLLRFRLWRLGCQNLHPAGSADRKSTRLNSSHRTISYAVFCLKKKKKKQQKIRFTNQER